MNTTIRIAVSDLKVSKHGWYRFNYGPTINGKYREGSCDGSYSDQSSEAFRKVLKRGYAVLLVIQQELA